MNMLWDKKKAMQTMIAKRKPGGGAMEVGPAPMKNEIVKDVEGEIDGRHMAAQDMMAAFHEKSSEKLMQSLSNFMDLHLAQPEKQDPRED